MEDPEVPLESSQEHIQHHAEHHTPERKWVLGVALSSAVFAALAAVASLQAGHHVNEALICQLQASDQWSYYQAKGIKAGILASRIELLEALGKPAGDQNAKALDRYAAEQEKIKKEAEALEEERAAHLRHHVTLATSVTMFQVCIAVAAISVLTGRRAFWWVSLAFGAAGVVFIASGLFGA
jgi:hypothetical protein